MWSPFADGDISAAATCLSDDGLEVPLIEAESESRSRSEGLGEVERMIGTLNAVEERRTAAPTRPHRVFLAESGGGVAEGVAEDGTGGDDDIVRENRVVVGYQAVNVKKNADDDSTRSGE